MFLFLFIEKMPILILFPGSSQSSPLARHSPCSCIGPQSSWPLPIKFPFAFAGASFSLSRPLLLRTFLPITPFHRNPDHCKLQYIIYFFCISGSVLIVSTEGLCLRVQGTVRSIPTKTWPRITLVKSSPSYFPLALSRDGSGAYASTNPAAAELERQNQKYLLPAQQHSAHLSLPAKGH